MRDRNHAQYSYRQDRKDTAFADVVVVMVVGMTGNCKTLPTARKQTDLKKWIFFKSVFGLRKINFKKFIWKYASLAQTFPEQ